MSIYCCKKLYLLKLYLALHINIIDISIASRGLLEKVACVKPITVPWSEAEISKILVPSEIPSEANLAPDIELPSVFTRLGDLLGSLILFDSIVPRRRNNWQPKE